MRKILLFGLFLLSFAVYGQNMKTVFINMPDSLSPLLTKINREDFVDFLESGMKAQVKNKFDNMSELKTLTKDYLFLQTTASSNTQMKLLPLNDSVKVVCLVNTVDGPASDSSVSFYTTDWKELSSTKYITMPSIDYFFLSNDTIDIEKQRIARSKADMNLIKMDLSPEDNTLSFAYTTMSYLNKESAEELKPFLRTTPIVYRWNEETFFTGH